jgi:diguanylate cyclase (GGDEF)-like protein
MGRDRDELARRRRTPRKSAVVHPSVDVSVDLDVDEGAQTNATQFVADHASAPEVLDLEADQRDSRAEFRDAAGVQRDARIDITDDDQVALDRMFAARDRAAAALDREEAALDRRRASEYLHRAYRDELTGVLQRAAGRDQMSHEVDRATRLDEPLVVAFLDVVNLKGVNDKYGHAAGDALLQAVGRALRGGLRSYDTVVRYGGDEFVCALPSARIVDAIRRFDEVERHLIELSKDASLRIGLAELQHGEALDEVISRADRELYDGATVLGSVRASIVDAADAARRGRGAS